MTKEQKILGNCMHSATRIVVLLQIIPSLDASIGGINCPHVIYFCGKNMVTGIPFHKKKKIGIFFIILGGLLYIDVSKNLETFRQKDNHPISNLDLFSRDDCLHKRPGSLVNNP